MKRKLLATLALTLGVSVLSSCASVRSAMVTEPSSVAIPSRTLQVLVTCSFPSVMESVVPS